MAHLGRCDDEAEAESHDGYVAAIIEQCVHRQAAGTSRKSPLRRLVENLLLGDAAKRRELNRWMYDRVNMTALLRPTGYREIVVQRWDTSPIEGWSNYGLDEIDFGDGHQQSSLFLEAPK